MEPDAMAGLAQGANQGAPSNNLDQIVAMLVQGVTPEELIQMGVPQELVMAAVDALMQQTQTMAPQQEGLAGMQLPRG